MLLRANAVKLSPAQPFTWASGWKSPVYCDNRLTLSFPDIRNYIKTAFCELVQQAFPGTEAIAGVATAGIPQAALVADLLQLPMLYVRSKPKGHGRENLIEGEVAPGTSIIVVEDLVSTGGSSIKAAQALQQAGYQVKGLVAVFTYGFAVADENFARAGIPFQTLTNYGELLQTALQHHYIKEKDLQSLQQWRQAPATWGQQ